MANPAASFRLCHMTIRPPPPHPPPLAPIPFVVDFRVYSVLVSLEYQHRYPYDGINQPTTVPTHPQRHHNGRLPTRLHRRHPIWFVLQRLVWRAETDCAPGWTPRSAHSRSPSGESSRSGGDLPRSVIVRERDARPPPSVREPGSFHVRLLKQQVAHALQQ